MLWAIGVPLGYAALLFGGGEGASTPTAQGQLASTLPPWMAVAPRLRAALAVLVGDYHHHYRHWELVVVGEKLVLTGFLALLQPGTWTQLFVGVVVTLFASTLQTRVAPYRSADDNLFAYLASLALVAVYAHPFEFVLSDLIPFAAPIFVLGSHVWFVWMWIVGAVLGTMSHHSGYRFPWLWSFDGQPDFHDFHHEKFMTNYGNIGLLDMLHGTDKMYIQYLKQRKEAAKADAKASTGKIS